MGKYFKWAALKRLDEVCCAVCKRIEEQGEFAMVKMQGDETGRVVGRRGRASEAKSHLVDVGEGDGVRR